MSVGEKRNEPLGSGITAVISREHGFGTDAVLLAYFAAPKKGGRLCDLGTGCGIIPLLWFRGADGISVDAVDIQPSACEQASRAVSLNGLEKKMRVHCADLRELRGVLPAGEYDLVTMNPPYKPVGTGIESENKPDLIARHEINCGIGDVTRAASFLLKYGGRLCVCHRPERLADVIVSMRENMLEPKRLRFVAKQEGSSPWLALIEGRRGGGKGLTVEPNIYVYDAAGEYSDEMRAALGNYRN